MADGRDKTQNQNTPQSHDDAAAPDITHLGQPAASWKTLLTKVDAGLGCVWSSTTTAMGAAAILGRKNVPAPIVDAFDKVFDSTPRSYLNARVQWALPQAHSALSLPMPHGPPQTRLTVHAITCTLPVNSTRSRTLQCSASYSVVLSVNTFPAASAIA